MPALALVLVAFVPAGRVQAAPTRLPEGVITEIRVEGNVTVTTEQVRAALHSKPGSPLDEHSIDIDIHNLNAKKWFSDVKFFYEEDKGRGYILIVSVRESPVLKHVEYRGRKKVKLKEIEELTGLKVGARADSNRALQAVGQIKRLYEEKGFEMAEVHLLEGGEPGATRVVFSIFEGSKRKLGHIDFEGNQFASDETLRTKITSKVPLIFGLGGRYHRDELDEDARKLREYYQGQGFFEVKVTPVTRPGSDLGDVRLTFVVAEGIRYKVRNISFEGNKRIPTEKLREGLMLHSGQPFRDAVSQSDHKKLMTKYYELGHIDAHIQPEPKYTDDPGVVDLVYRVDEGEPFVLGELIVRGNERTKDRVIRFESVQAGLLPG
jgi:outer membrane protein insertion porin family